MRRVLVVGTGRAGQARMRCLAARPDVEGVSLSARSSHFQLRLDEHLADTHVKAVLVCTDNASHFEIAKQALTAGKHVLVEFPLTHSADQAQTLLALAKRFERILHVEYIGLMAAAHRAFHALDTQNWARVLVTLEGGYYRWVETECEAGHFGSLMNGRLQALHHLLGPLDLVSAHANRRVDGYRASVCLKSRGGVHVELVDTRGVDMARVRKMEVFDACGNLIVPTIEQGRIALFEADLDVFYRKIENKQIEWSLPTDLEILEVVRLSEAISHQCVSTLGGNAIQMAD
jgi:predicted dehydrogenase